MNKRYDRNGGHQISWFRASVRACIVGMLVWLALVVAFIWVNPTLCRFPGSPIVTTPLTVDKELLIRGAMFVLMPSPVIFVLSVGLLWVAHRFRSWLQIGG